MLILLRIQSSHSLGREWRLHKRPPQVESLDHTKKLVQDIFRSLDRQAIENLFECRKECWKSTI
jgi:hypothetical protein